MSATTQGLTGPQFVPKQEHPKRHRRGAQGGRKVKTGCWTCKIRHKKCDERRPTCSQCARMGWKCDLLSSETPPRPLRQPGTRPWSLASEPDSDTLLDAVDFWHFDYFRVVCTKEFSLCLGTPIWETVVLRAALTERCILNGVIALGALSRNTVPSSVSGKPMLSPGFSVGYSLSKYNSAIQQLNRRLAEPSCSWELAVLGSIIFIAIESLQRNYNAAQMHLRGALAILESHGDTAAGGSQTKIEMTYVLSTFSRLSGQRWKSMRLPAPVPLQFPTLPPYFTNISGARDALNSVTAAMISLLWKGTGGNHRPAQLPLTPALVQDLSRLSRLLDSWHTLFVRFLADHTMDTKTTSCVKILLIHHQVSRISASACFSSNQSAYDAHIADFSRIIELATEILDADHGGGRNGTDSRGSGAGHQFGATLSQPLFFVACKCRNGVLRRKAIEALEALERTTWDGSGFYDARLWTRVARYIVATEEKTSSETGAFDVFVKEEDRLQDIELDFGNEAGAYRIRGWRRLANGYWQEVVAHLEHL